MKKNQTVSLKNLKLISVGMICSPLVFLVVSFLVHSQPVPDYYLFEFHVMPEKQTFLMFILLVTFAGSILSLFLPKILSEQSKEESEKNLFFNWNELTNRKFATTLMRLFIVDWIALLGLVFSFMNHAFLNMVPFALLSMVLAYMYSPFYKTHINDAPH